MNEDLLDYWLRMIKPLFPSTAWFASSLSHGDYLIQIDWKLDNDPHQPNKRSRKIQIIVKEHAIDDYLDKNKNDRALADGKMIKWLSERYNQFSADHDALTPRSVTTERWCITRDFLRQ
jgi:hypothetical protein